MPIPKAAICFLVLMCSAVGEDVSVEDFLQSYSADAERMRRVYENSQITVERGERKISVVGFDGQWISEFETAGRPFVEAYTTKGRFNLVKKEDWTPRKVIKHPTAPSLDESRVSFNGDEFLAAYCWQGRPILDLLSMEGHRPFVGIQKKGKLYELSWHHDFLGGRSVDGVLTLDSEKHFAVVRSAGLSRDTLKPQQRPQKGTKRYRYSLTQNSVPIMSFIEISIDQPDGSIYESTVSLRFDLQPVVDRGRFLLGHYGLSENLWIGNGAPSPSLWSRVPGWFYLMAMGIAFFGAAAYVRRRSAR